MSKSDEDEIEATKAPLMDHLIELRSRLIKALIAFAAAFIVCFFFAGRIYNVLIFPFEWVAGSDQTRFIYTALLEYFWTQLKLAMFGAMFGGGGRDRDNQNIFAVLAMALLAPIAAMAIMCTPLTTTWRPSRGVSPHRWRATAFMAHSTP